MLFATEESPVIKVRSGQPPLAGASTVVLVAEVLAPVPESPAQGDDQSHELAGLPDMQADAVYIVGPAIAERAPAGRTDLLVPSPGLRHALYGFFGATVAGFRHPLPRLRPRGDIWSVAELLKLIQEAIGGPPVPGGLLALASIAHALDLIPVQDLDIIHAFDQAFSQGLERFAASWNVD